MCSVLIILDLLSKILDRLRGIKPSNISMLFSMLRLQPDISKSPYSCTDLRFLQNYLGERSCRDVAGVLVKFTNLMLSTGIASQLEWVNVIPLIHIFKQRVESFGPPALKYDDICWTDPDLKLLHIKPQTSDAILKYVY